VSGKAWNVYRVGGDEFAITALVRYNDRELFRSAAQSLADVQIPWVNLVVDCKSTGTIFARIGGVFGKYVKYEDADIIERNIKERNKHSRKTLMQPEKIERVLLYYLDADDRNWVIAENEKEIQAAVRMREFSRCSAIQDYIKFLREGFLALKKENISDVKMDSALSRGDTEFSRCDTTLYNSNAIQRLTKRTNLEEIYIIDESDGSESSIRPFVPTGKQEGHLSVPNAGFQETKVNDAKNENQINQRDRTVSAADIDDPTDDPPPYQSDSDKDGNTLLKKPTTSHKARPSQSVSEASGESGTVHKIAEYKSSSTSDSQVSQSPKNIHQAGKASLKV